MTNTVLECPVLFLIFRQPEITRKVFEQIRAARPTQLFIAADGPRSDHPGDAEECEMTREVVSEIDWECEVHTRFLPKNYGLKKAVSSALDWFFDSVDEGIILEYDCLPDPSFFEYCAVMLDRYRHDMRIFSISGSTIQTDTPRGDGDYYYSRFTGVWGWATWKRSWQLWRPVLEDYDTFRTQSIMDSIVTVDKGRDFWLQSFDAVFSGENTTTWAFCLVYAQIKQGGYCVVPNKNLINNIGFGTHATNAVDVGHPLAGMEVSAIESYTAPTFFVPNLDADNELSLRAVYSPANPLYKRIPKYALRKGLGLLKWLS